MLLSQIFDLIALMEIKEAVEQLADWYKTNKRALPWRTNPDPYRVWIAEIVFQQTRIDQGLAYYKRLLHHFPTVADLAEASQDEVLKHWEGLGYYSRARNLHATAKKIHEDKQFPLNYTEWLAMKGVGPYTAAAIASVCYEEKVPLVDGNVYRLLSRLFADPTPIDSSAGKKIFYKYAAEFMQLANRPGDHNQAMMELGSLVCKPANPLCSTCPLADFCHCMQTGQEPSHFPKKSPAKAARKRYFHFLFSPERPLYFEKRGEKDIWNGLYTLPLFETKQNEDANIAEICKLPIEKIELMEEKTHLLSHQKLYLHFWKIPDGKWLKNNPQKYVEMEDVPAVPVPIRDFLKKYL